MRAEQCADAVGAILGGVFHTLDRWRAAVVALGPGARGPELDALVERLVVPELEGDDPLLTGAGVVAAPGFLHGRDVRFSWWLGASEGTPLAGPTTEPTRLDLTTRGHMEYVRDYSTLEWFAVPARTHARHITGPYVDQLCACDYILTFTVPLEIDGRLLGVVGADVLVRRLERELLPYFGDRAHPLILVNAVGRVVVSTDPVIPAGSLRDPSAPDSIACPGTPFRLLQPPAMAAA